MKIHTSQVSGIVGDVSSEARYLIENQGAFNDHRS